MKATSGNEMVGRPAIRHFRLVSQSVVAAAALLIGGIVTAGPTAALSKPATFTPSSQAITACVKALPASKAHLALTLDQAERCTQGAPVYETDHLPSSGPATSLYIIDHAGKATINLATHTPASRNAGNATAQAASSAGCYNSYSSGSVSWWGGDNGGSISATGYGNHCGYSQITGFTPSFWCVCTGMSYSKGSYDSNYGRWAFNYPYAAVWVNGELSTGLVHWQNFIRLYLNSYGGWWNYIQLG